MAYLTSRGAAAKKTRLLNRQIAAGLAAEAAAKEALAEANAKIETLTIERDEARDSDARNHALADERRGAIAAFKEEHLALQLQAAEMRGYISRVLEDDLVREAGPFKSDQPLMPEAERHALTTALMSDNEARRGAQRPVRQGPPSMRPVAVIDGWAAEGAGNMAISSTRSQFTTRRPEHPHWMNR